jgi:hypothetical protein
VNTPFAIYVGGAFMLGIMRWVYLTFDQFAHDGEHVVFAFIDEDLGVVYIGLSHLHVAVVNMVDPIARAEVSVELPERIRSAPSFALMPRMLPTRSGPIPSNGPHFKLSGLWVATYFVAAFRRSAIGLFGALGQ